MMTRISASSPSSVSSPSSIVYKRIYGSSPKVSSLGRGVPKGLAVETFTEFLLLMGSTILEFINFQNKLIINWTSGSNIIMLHLSNLWLQSTSVSVLYKLLDYTKVIKICCYEIVSD